VSIASNVNQKTAAAQAFPAILTNADADGAQVFRIVARMHRRVVVQRASCAPRRCVNTSLSWTLFF
jgi:hypothetical protein